MTEALLASLHFTRYADVLPALRECRQLDLRIAVVSNWDVSLHAVLDRLGLGGFLDAVVTSAEFGARKPAREIFEHALALVGGDGAVAWHVGDSLEEDVLGARSAGITPILISRGVPAGAPDVETIASLAELPAIVRERLVEAD
jgi:putative hydrolase of the HAD superfamily